MNKTDNNYKLLYKTNNRNDHTEEEYHWFEFRLKGDIIYKYRCQKHKILDNDKNSWEIEETIEKTWVADSMDLPDFLKQIIKSSKDPEVKKFSVMRTIENPNGYESKNFFKTHKKGIIIGGSIAAGAAALAIILLHKNPEVISRIANPESLKAIVPNKLKTVVEVAEGTHAIPVSETISAARSIPSEPFQVRAFVRNLPEGWHASEAAIQNAQAAGIALEEGQTFVTEFIKYLYPAA